MQIGILNLLAMELISFFELNIYQSGLGVFGYHQHILPSIYQ